MRPARHDALRAAGAGETARLVAEHDWPTALGDARAHEAERERPERLAERRHAKTALFSNLSRELRTPLTLMLGPLEAALPGGAGLADRCVA